MSTAARDRHSPCTRCLEQIDLAAPVVPRAARSELIRGFVAAYCDSDLARASRASKASRRSGTSRSSTTACSCTASSTSSISADGRALVVDYKTNALGEASPEEIVEQDYRLQRLVYALACFRAGAEEVEVVYHFLERPDAPVEAVFTRADVPELEAELSAAIARIQAGRVPADAERLRLRGLPGARPRLRGPAPAPAPARGSCLVAT